MCIVCPDSTYPPVVYRALKRIADMNSAMSDSESDCDDTVEQRRIIPDDKDKTSSNTPIEQTVREGN